MLATIFYDPDGNPGHPSAIREARGVFKGQIKTLNTMDKHFELTDKFIINAFGAKLFQIKCTRKIKYADIGDLGGYIEKEDNLSGNAWVYGDAKVSGNA